MESLRKVLVTPLDEEGKELTNFAFKAYLYGIFQDSNSFQLKKDDKDSVEIIDYPSILIERISDCQFIKGRLDYDFTMKGLEPIQTESEQSEKPKKKKIDVPENLPENLIETAIPIDKKPTAKVKRKYKKKVKTVSEIKPEVKKETQINEQTVSDNHSDTMPLELIKGLPPQVAEDIIKDMKKKGGKK